MNTATDSAARCLNFIIETRALLAQLNVAYNHAENRVESAKDSHDRISAEIEAEIAAARVARISDRLYCLETSMLRLQRAA